MTHPLVGRAAVANTSEGEERPGTVHDVEEVRDRVRVELETEDGILNIDSERVEVLG